MDADRIFDRDSSIFVEIFGQRQHSLLNQVVAQAVSFVSKRKGMQQFPKRDGFRF